MNKKTFFHNYFINNFFGRTIEYGIIKGNNQILFIKPGQDGSILGYNNKYYNLATYVNSKYGFTVICSNNPYDGVNNPLDDAMGVIEEYVKVMGFDDYNVYYYGSSCGGVLGARYSYLYPKIKRALLINPPLFINFHKIQKGILNFQKEALVFVFGEFDPSKKFVGMLDCINSDKVHYTIIEGEDHNLSKNVRSLESLVDEYLFNEQSFLHK